MSPFLPNTNITSLSIGSNIYCYVQSYHGELMELRGRISTTKKYANVYSRDDQTNIGLTVRYREEDDEDEEEIESHAPKMFTPLAAASLGTTRYLIYVNDNNILQDVVFKNGEWQKGKLCQLKDSDGKTGIRCAPYSKLAATTAHVEGQDNIYLYYQADGKHGPVRMISFVPGNSWRTTYYPDGRIVVQWVDPPLYGTSLTSVKPREGIIVEQKDEKLKQLPIVYLQWDTQALAEGQEIRAIPGLEEFQLSPHTSLTTVDDGANLYCFYKSNDNAVRMIRIADGNAVEVLHDVVVPTPRSYIAAVMPLQHKNRIVLFYQYWGHGKSEKVDIKAKTLSRGPGDVWQVTTEANVLSG
ncbi:hypothetical protein H634G_09627 [Metarhizium anisopliae BRIP 53293]|uniref:Fucose-specific lectin n=1 Tax=Metarhizium anisopliae BRIP 53293 TaxID=1291518 RepID=A0A0D9NLM9_METAN|nr:hypothetical protein H634G_09627 [Metarhizium anisopliae BRIP 53293]KJK90330.1 hypothetical protein H633G_05803 [Metarhizium anisopliae BRIP 53284]